MTTRHGFSPAHLVLAMALGALVGGCGDEEPEPGELMVVVTTDMAVPSDIDTLSWSVTLDGKSEAFASGTLELASNDDIPATLAIRGGPKTKEPVTIRVEGWRRGAGDQLRVAREATLTVPEDRVAKLSMPLTWFCSDANPLVCPAGQTCNAGSCVDSVVSSSSLPDYVAPETRTCLDVTSCFGGQRFRGLPAIGESGRCTLGSGDTSVGSDANVNVALVVGNELVGNYGFCGPYEECYILLPQSDGPEGWQAVEVGERLEIRLPDAVCDGVARYSVAGVMTMNPAPSCPVYRSDRPFCAPPDDACLPSLICPKEWGKRWLGYACSGAATPLEADPSIQACWTPPSSIDEQTTQPNGRFCCTTGTEPSNDPLLIDDMSGGPSVKITPPEGSVAGWWWTTLADGTGSLEPGLPPTLYTYRTFDPPITPPNGPEIKAAACLRSEGFSSWVAIQGFNFTNLGGDSSEGTYGPEPIDVSDYSGISFWGWAAEPFEDAPLSIQVAFPNVDTQWGDRNAPCWTPENGSNGCDNFMKDVSLTSEWKPYFVRWDELHQSFQEWSPPQKRFPTFNTLVNQISFVVPGGGLDVMSAPFDFCIAHIRFTE